MYGVNNADSSATNHGQITHNVNGLELLDFFDGANDNVDQFVSLIRGETAESPFANNFGHCDDLIGGFWADNQFGPATSPGDVFAFNNSVLSNSFPSFDGEMKGAHHQDHDHDDQEPDEDEDQEDGDRPESSETNGGSTSTAKTQKTSKADRSRTLISERRRRGRMKEKLYALRSLVPNITKMDKASIVEDAVRYVQQLQMEAKKLNDEIAGLEASLLGPDRHQTSTYSSNQIKFEHVPNTNQLIYSKNVIQMDIFQVDERGFYMRLVCNKGDGVAASLYKVLESLTSFNVQSSNVSSATDRLELTVTLRVKETIREIMSLPNMKLLLVGALLNEGFEFKSPV